MGTVDPKGLSKPIIHKSGHNWILIIPNKPVRIYRSWEECFRVLNNYYEVKAWLKIMKERERRYVSTHS